MTKKEKEEKTQLSAPPPLYPAFVIEHQSGRGLCMNIYIYIYEHMYAYVKMWYPTGGRSLTNDSPSMSWKERCTAGTSAAHNPEAPALLPCPKGESSCSLGSTARLFLCDKTVAVRLLRPMNDTTCDVQRTRSRVSTKSRRHGAKKTDKLVLYMQHYSEVLEYS